jgi:hypothetical protein
VSRVRIDRVALVVLVALVLALAPGHGALGWALAFAGALIAGGLLGAFGRRYPAIYGARRRRPRDG